MRNWSFAPGALAIAGVLLLSIAGDSAGEIPPAEMLFQKNHQWQLPYAPRDIVQSVDGKLIFILTENQRLLIYEPNGNLKGTVQVNPGITAIEIDARGENVLLIDKEKNTISSFSVDFVAEIDITGSPVKGNPNAPVTIAVFSDFE